MVYMGNDIPLFDVDVIAYSCLSPEYDLGNLS